jgi:type I restriction enzyme R subunit
MSVYTEVEQPFLSQLEAWGCNIIDQGQEIPFDPAYKRRVGRFR